ncbi:MAG TPA: hypothetical protein VFH17_06795 [Coriobacteriia bacterium]|nr:hypothetical protein [Coriobacteriia bacterium]
MTRSRHGVLLFVASLCVAMLIAGTYGTADALGSVGLRRVADADALFLRPATNDDRMVYVRSSGGTHVVWIKDLSTGRARALSDGVSNAFAPDIYGDLVVWEEHRDRTVVIALYDLTDGDTQIISPGPDDRAPTIWGDTVAWTQEGVFRARLMSRDLSTGQTRTVAVVEPGTTCGLYESTLAHDDGGDIHLLELESGVTRVLVGGPARSEKPDICGDTAVFTEWGGGLADVRAVDLNTGVVRTIISGYQCVYAPSICEQFIAYETYHTWRRPSIEVVRVGDELRVEAPTAWYDGVLGTLASRVDNVVLYAASLQAAALTLLIG